MQGELSILARNDHWTRKEVGQLLSTAANLELQVVFLCLLIHFFLTCVDTGSSTGADLRPHGVCVEAWEVPAPERGLGVP